MKRILLITLTALFSITVCQANMNSDRVRIETRFLTDRMAYELNLTTYQYNDVYEINYDFINSIRYLTDDILMGYSWALDRYYEYLDMRNDDLRWVLNRGQFKRFLRTEYFFRPAYIHEGRWSFRVFVHYKNHNHYYYPRPHHYYTYQGAHCRHNHPRNSYYHGRYSHPTYETNIYIRNNKAYKNERRSDFKDIKRHHNNKRYERNENRTHREGTSRDNRYNSSYRPKSGSSTENRNVSTGVRNYTKEQTKNTRTNNEKRSSTTKEKRESNRSSTLRTGSSRGSSVRNNSLGTNVKENARNNSRSSRSSRSVN